MTTINLLPSEAKEEKKKLKFNVKIFAILFYVFLILILIAIGLEVAGRTLDIRVGDRDIKSKKIESEINSMKSIEDSAKALNSSLETITLLEKDHLYWSKILAEIAVDTPIKVQITNLVYSPGNNPSFNLVGSAESATDIAKFKEKLESSSFFKDVIFVSATRAEQDGKAYYSFNFTFNLEKANDEKSK